MISSTAIELLFVKWQQKEHLEGRRRQQAPASAAMAARMHTPAAAVCHVVGPHGESSREVAHRDGTVACCCAAQHVFPTIDDTCCTEREMVLPTIGYRSLNRGCYHCTITVQLLCHHCTITVPTLYHHCTITISPPHTATGPP